jgi:2-hydroxychromene-2-carboxylate isomerase
MHVNPSPKFMCPDATLASCIVIAASAAGHDVVPLYKAIMHAEWCADLDISSPRTLLDILEACGFDAPTLMGRALTSEVARAYSSFTDRAVAAGVFGSPSYVFRGELFWGQDRLDFLEEAVARPDRT